MDVEKMEPCFECHNGFLRDSMKSCILCDSYLCLPCAFRPEKQSEDGTAVSNEPFYCFVCEILKSNAVSQNLPPEVVIDKWNCLNAFLDDQTRTQYLRSYNLEKQIRESTVKINQLRAKDSDTTTNGVESEISTDDVDVIEPMHEVAEPQVHAEEILVEREPAEDDDRLPEGWQGLDGLINNGEVHNRAGPNAAGLNQAVHGGRGIADGGAAPGWQVPAPQVPELQVPAPQVPAPHVPAPQVPAPQVRGPLRIPLIRTPRVPILRIPAPRVHAVPVPPLRAPAARVPAANVPAAARVPAANAPAARAPAANARARHARAPHAPTPRESVRRLRSHRGESHRRDLRRRNRE